MSNQEVTIQFPNGEQKRFAKGVTLTEIAESISPSLAKKSIAGSVNTTTTDLTRPILVDAEISLYDASSKEGLSVLRHSTAHLLAQAVKRMYPDAKFGVGPVIENGFYYDIEMSHTLVPEDLPFIEREMKKIVNENYAIVLVRKCHEKKLLSFLRMIPWS